MLQWRVMPLRADCGRIASLPYIRAMFVMLQHRRPSCLEATRTRSIGGVGSTRAVAIRFRGKQMAASGAVSVTKARRSAGSASCRSRGRSSPRRASRTGLCHSHRSTGQDCGNRWRSATINVSPPMMAVFRSTTTRAAGSSRSFRRPARGGRSSAPRRRPARGQADASACGRLRWASRCRWGGCAP